MKKREKIVTPARLRATAALLGVTFLAGCAGFNIREELGIVGAGPDEFSVVKKRPLQMPTDMQELPPPRPGAPSLVDPRPAEDAQLALTGRAQPAATDSSRAEEAFLIAAGANKADPDIREKLEEDETRLTTVLLDTIMMKDKDEGSPLDAGDEAERLAEEARQSKNPFLERAPSDGDAEQNQEQE